MTGIELHLETDQAIDAVSFIAEHSGLSKGKVKNAMSCGAVWLERNGKQKRLRRATTELIPSDKVALYYSPEIIEISPSLPTLIADLRSCSIWDKPAGIMSSGSRFGDHCAINRIIEKQFDRPTHLVHRLDKFVWGLMIVAHGKKSAANLSKQFESRQTRKIYHAVVHGGITGPCSIDTAIDDRSALSHIRPIRQAVRQGAEQTLVEVEIHTGRKHQIRKHLAGIGHPVVGDRLYGSANVKGIQLCATELSFLHPDNDEPLYFQLDEQRLPTL